MRRRRRATSRHASASRPLVEEARDQQERRHLEGSPAVAQGQVEARVRRLPGSRTGMREDDCDDRGGLDEVDLGEPLAGRHRISAPRGRSRPRRARSSCLSTLPVGLRGSSATSASCSGSFCFERSRAISHAASSASVGGCCRIRGHHDGAGTLPGVGVGQVRSPPPRAPRDARAGDPRARVR